MSSKTRIIVLHMKEIIYTGIFIALGILLLVLLFIMFRPAHSSENSTPKKYTPGIYTSTFALNDTNLEVEVLVDDTTIRSIRFSNLDESIATAYPLIRPAMENIAEQIYQQQSLDHIELDSDHPYTSQIILTAIKEAVEKAAA